MQEITNLDKLKREIAQMLNQQQIPHIWLTVPSMLGETPEKIKSEIAKFNQMIDYLLKTRKTVCIHYSRRKFSYHI